MVLRTDKTPRRLQMSSEAELGFPQIRITRKHCVALSPLPPAPPLLSPWPTKDRYEAPYVRAAYRSFKFCSLHAARNSIAFPASASHEARAHVLRRGLPDLACGQGSLFFSSAVFFPPVQLALLAHA
jgi:hypothetical protein